MFLITLITEKPWWFIVFCIAAGAAYALILYPFSSLKPVAGKKPILLWWMTGFRFVTITLMAYLLMSPLIKTANREVLKPIIVIAQDNSQSILLNRDSVFYRTTYLQKLEALRNRLQEKFDVQYYSFGKHLNEQPIVDFQEKQTNISALTDVLYDKFEGQNLGAVVIATDGIFNQGSNPLYGAKKLRSALYTLALGDTTQPRDVVIKKVRSNAIAYLGNSFPIEIEIAAHGFTNTPVVVSVVHQGVTESVQTLNPTGPRYLQTILLNFDAKTRGMQRYTISASHLNGELSYLNNVKDVYIDVIDGRQKILILANAPHPDLGALKNAIESNQNYEAQIQYAYDLPVDIASRLKDFSLIILHQIPSIDFSAKPILDALEKFKIPRLYILGNQSNIPVFNNLDEGLFIANNRGNVNDALPSLSKDFNQFMLSDETVGRINRFPPLISPFGTYAPSGDVKILLYQKIGTTLTSIPLMQFANKSDHKAGVLCGEGIWRWRLQEYAQTQSQSATNEVLTKTIQYLSAKDDKRLLRVTSMQKTFEENEHVVFDAEVYTPSYELTTDPEVGFKVTNEDGKNFEFQFSKNGKTFHLDCGILPVGSYTFNATTMSGGKPEAVSGKFTVIPLQAEFTETVANHQLLASWAGQNHGSMFYPAHMEAIADSILANESIKPMSYERQQLRDLVNLKLIFGILLFTLTVEWFFRKRDGGY